MATIKWPKPPGKSAAAALAMRKLRVKRWLKGYSHIEDQGKALAIAYADAPGHIRTKMDLFQRAGRL